MVSKTVLIVAGLLLGGAGLATAHYYANDESPIGLALEKARPFPGKGPGGCGPASEDPEGVEAGMAGRGHRCGPKGQPFTSGDGAVSGRHVSFTEAPGGLLDYTSEGPWAEAVIFDAVTVEGLAGQGMVKGPTYRLGGKETGLGLVAFNAPNAALMVKSRDGATVTYDVADDVAVTLLENGDVQLSRGDAQARIHVRNGTLAVDGDVVTATLGPQGAAGFAIEGYPRLLHMERHALRHGGPHDR